MSLNLSDFYTNKNKNRRIISTPKFLDAYYSLDEDEREPFRKEFVFTVLDKPKITTHDKKFLKDVGYNYFSKKAIVQFYDSLFDHFASYKEHYYTRNPIWHWDKILKDNEFYGHNYLKEKSLSIERRFLGTSTNDIFYNIFYRVPIYDDNKEPTKIRFATKDKENNFLNEMGALILKTDVMELKELAKRIYENVDFIRYKKKSSIYDYLKRM